MNGYSNPVDSSNVKELTADVVNAGVIKAKHIEIGSETSYQTGYSPGDLRIEMETKFSVIDGAKSRSELNKRILTC